MFNNFCQKQAHEGAFHCKGKNNSKEIQAKAGQPELPGKRAPQAEQTSKGDTSSLPREGDPPIKICGFVIIAIF